MAKGKYHKWLDPDNLIRLEGWARSGLTDEQIAKNIGITATTLYDWKNKYSEISEALKKGKDVVDLEVENALLKSAMGYDVEETTEELRYNHITGKHEMVVTKKNRKHIQPNTTAQIFWLKNRKPEIWRDKVENVTNLKLEDETMQRMDDYFAKLERDSKSDME